MSQEKKNKSRSTRKGGFTTIIKSILRRTPLPDDITFSKRVEENVHDERRGQVHVSGV